MATKKITTVEKKDKIKATLSVYENYDLTGGGPPFGHVRTFCAELSLGKKPIIRYRNAGHDLVKLIEKQGKPIGNRESLPRGRDYSDGYKQTYFIPGNLTRKKIEKQIPFESVLERVSF